MSVEYFLNGVDWWIVEPTSLLRVRYLVGADAPGPEELVIKKFFKTLEKS